MQNLKDKVVIITGASSGIGEATAYKLAQEGAKIVLAARKTSSKPLPIKLLQMAARRCIAAPM